MTLVELNGLLTKGEIATALLIIATVLVLLLVTKEQAPRKSTR